MCGIFTPKSVLASTRVLLGLKNATAYFQSMIETVFQELRQKVKAWVDDFNLHASNDHPLLSLLDRFSQICVEKGLYLSGRKCVFFNRSVKYCGWVISEAGSKMDPIKTEGLGRWACLPQPTIYRSSSTAVDGCPVPY